MLSDNAKVICFMIYTLVYEIMVWGLVASAIYFLHWNEWTVIVGIIMSASQLQPKHFGLKYKEDMENANRNTNN